MNIRSLTLALLTSTTLTCSAIDRVVDVTGTGGAFTTITAALTAAQDGDRILVIPQAGFFVENLVMDKSLQLMSATEGQRINLQGNISIAPTVAGREITVQNVLFASGFGITSSLSPAGQRTAVRVLDCKLLGGSLNMANSNYDVTIARDSLMNGGVNFRFGKVVGNFINGFINCNSDAASEDINHIVGNRFVLPQGSYFFSPISLSNNTQYTRFENNYILGTNGLAFSTGNALILMQAAKTGSGMNTVVNNTILSSANLFPASGSALILANVGSAPGLRIWNNLITATGTASGIAIASSSLIPVHFNALKTGLTISGTPTGTNIPASNSHTFITASTGALSIGADAINAGDPAVEFTDLDLTRNDIGCYGGSFSLDNFLAPGSAGAVVTFVDVPRRALQGGTVDIKATGFDR